MKLEIPEIPRDRPLFIAGRDVEFQISKFALGPFCLQVDGWYSNVANDFKEVGPYWRFESGGMAGPLEDDEAKALGLPKLETRRNGDKLEVWAVDWE